MKLQNLQILFSQQPRDPHVITYVNANGALCKATVYTSHKFAQRVIDCLEAVPTLIKERDELNTFKESVAECLGHPPVAFKKDLLEQILSQNTKYFALKDERDALRNQVERLELTCENQRELLANAPDTTQPQLSEIRYVLHGDIQPCSVLYSDDTTTLLRLDEGDMMLETDTIEWSDSVTYRCQELLKSAAVKLSVPVTLSPIKLLAQLVRDERILLNDNGNDELESNPNAETLEAIGKVFVEALGSKEIELPCDECSHVFDAQSMTCPMCMTIRSSEHPTAVVPAPPPMPHQKPDQNNPYLHTNSMFTEEAMRRHGWTNEALVSCGHGHYVPVQHPADTER